MKAEIELIKQESGKYILIRDIGHNRGRSVTSDAEYVITLLYSDYGITDETRILYEDSAGRIDEIVHDGLRLTGFKAGHEGIDLE